MQFCIPHRKQVQNYYCCDGDSGVGTGNSAVKLVLVWCKVYMALDHIHYARWIPVHLRNWQKFHNSTQRPTIYSSGHFTVQKSFRALPAFPLDQAHKQNNARVKGDGSAIGLTCKSSAPELWSLRRRTCIQMPMRKHVTMKKTKCTESISQRCTITCGCHGRASRRIVQICWS